MVTSSVPSQLTSPTSTVNESSFRHATEQFLSDHAVFLFGIPAASLVAVALVTLGVFLFFRRWRKQQQQRRQVPTFRYDPTDTDDADWESNLLEETDPPFVRNSQRSIIRTSLPARSVPGS